MLRYESTLAPGVHIAFTTTAEGNLAIHVPDDRDVVLLRRRDLERVLGLGKKQFSYMNQVHSATVLDASSRAADSEVPTCDALVCIDAGEPMAVMVADCVPVILVGIGPRGTSTAVAHAGRRGLLDGILASTTERLRGVGATAIEAWIGPAICGLCYEVGVDMAAEARQQRPGIVSKTYQGTTGLDLPGAAAHELRNLGVTVTESRTCTLEDHDFFSYRRNPDTGRLAGLVWKTPGNG